MQWVILAMTTVSAAVSVLVLALVCAERKRSGGTAGANGEERREVSAAGTGVQTGAGDEGAESAETLRARLAERRFSEGVMNVLNYENPAGKGNGA